MKYYSTRQRTHVVSAAEAILQGIAPDGGLYVPERIPQLPLTLDQLLTVSYQEIAHAVLSVFTGFSDEDLWRCVQAAYCKPLFRHEDIAPIHRVGDAIYLELFHGQTIAFKDMALSILPHLMALAATYEQSDQQIAILTATSGDTGKAALAGFADVPNTRIIVFYPENGVSDIQEQQMVKQTGENTHVIAIKGNFDQAQSEVKRLFADEALRQVLADRGYRLSSANSINIGRLLPQIVYYCFAYAQAVKQGVLAQGETLPVVVPTGNFGNILAAYYAKQMGLPLGELVCASNINHVLTDFFKTGTYDYERPFMLTNTPSMDILLSSNLERFVHYLCDSDSERTAALMQDLAARKSYQLSGEEFNRIASFEADYVTESEVTATIADVYRAHDGYVIDPHTAVAAAVAKRLNLRHPLIVATASPFKFPETVLTALGTETAQHTVTEQLSLLAALSHQDIPEPIAHLAQQPVRHHAVVAVDEMRQAVLDRLV